MSTTGTIAIAGILDAQGCGWTLDVQQDDPQKVVQWLWAAPVATLDASSPQSVGFNLSDQVLKLGLNLLEPDNVTTHLPNQVEVLKACPFRPQHCDGEHVVASGTGTLCDS